MEVKDMTTIARKFVSRASAASQDYKEGVQRTTKDQAQSAIASKEAWETGVQEAIAGGRFEKGLARSGHAKWKEKASGKGVRNYPTGVRESEGDFTEGFTPYHSALQAITLPPRGPRGAPQNLERVRVISERLHAVRVGS